MPGHQILGRLLETQREGSLRRFVGVSSSGISRIFLYFRAFQDKDESEVIRH